MRQTLTDLPEPTDPPNLGRAGGRGLGYMRHDAQPVRFNNEGNMVTWIRRWELQPGAELTTHAGREGESCS